MQGTITYTPGPFSTLRPSILLPSGVGENYVLLLTANARAQFVVIVIQDTIQDFSGCWHFAKSVMGINSSELYFFRGEFLIRSLGFGAVDIIITGRGSLL